MNSDEIERLQRASAMTAPEARRSTETPVSTNPLCASTLKQRRDASTRDCARLCATRFWQFHDIVFGTVQNVSDHTDGRK